MAKKQMLRMLVTFLLLLIGIFAKNPSAQAAISEEALSKVGDVSEIGQYDESVSGLSHVGVKIYWDDELECYALDTHEMTEYGYWLYVLSDVNGYVSNLSSGYSNSASPIHLYYVNDNGRRFKVRADMIRNGREDYSVIIEGYVKGKRISRFYQITGITVGEFGTDKNVGGASFFQENMEIGGHKPGELSYIYNVYTVRKIEPDAEEISLEEHGGEMETEGKAYVYKDGGYVLTKLPTANMTKEGYECKLEGWYTAATGGSKYQVGDILQKGDVLHARWSITPKKYDVICVDIRGNDPNGVVLGQKTWQADFGSEVTGATQGNSTVAGAYYPHCCYKSATKAKVTTAGATVYRYFSYETYSVTFVDRIISGTREGETLKKETREAEYTSTVAGSELGIDRAPGAYYEGYCYDACTSVKVTGSGLTVYRNFKPVKYTILLDGNGAQEGVMTTTYECEYDKEVTLKINRFQKTSTITLYQDAAKNAEDTTEITVKQKFLGWSKEKNGAVCIYDNETLKNVMNKEGTITLYAVWSEETVLLPELPATVGYSFIGWAKEANASKGFKQINVADSMELYAVWEKSIVKYHVEYYKENANGEYELTSNYDFEGYVDDEVTLSLDNEVYQGFSLDMASSTLSGTIKADGSLILCAYYRRNAYNFSYDLNGGSLPSGEIPEKSKIKFGANITLTSFVPEKEGYLFIGWCQENDSTHTLFQPRDSFVMQNHDVVMHAQWKRLSFKVKYDKNEKVSMIAGITGEVPDTEYVYQKDSYASELVFQSEVGEVLSWNTKPDGSGITILPGANIKGLFDTSEELTLYAVWQPKVSDSDVSFKITLYEMADGEKKELTTLKLYGKAGEKISVTLLRLYQSELQDESVIYFYKGYEVVNAEALEELISLDSNTEISLEVKERACKVFFDIGDGENLDEVISNYQETYRLPESLGDGLQVERYEDDLGNCYYPGDEIILEKNLKLKIQQAVYLHDELGEKKEEIIYVVRGEDFVLPECTQNGYRFLGWYDSLGKLVGRAGEVVKDITKRCDYYARWSEPLTYSVSFAIENSGVEILEGEVSYHQYTKDTILPTKDQVVVPEGYEFEGWYDSTDENKKIITKISAFEYGDKILKPYLSEKKESSDEGDTSTEEKKDAEDSEEKDSALEEEDVAENKKEDSSEKEQEENIENVTKPEEGSDNESTEGSKETDNKKDDTENNASGQNSGVKKQPNTSKTYQVGDTFWKGKLKYKVLSVQNGKEKVMVVAVKKNAAKIKMTSKVVYGNVSYKVAIIGKKAFYKANKLKKLVIPNTVVRIKKSAFSKMKKLQTVIIGSGVKRIETKAFYGNKKLSKVMIRSKRLSTIGKNAFYKIKKNGKMQVPIGKKKTYLKLLRTSKLQKNWKVSN